MADMKPELSKRCKYWINKHRFYELKHFCLQYRDWKKAVAAINSSSMTSTIDYISAPVVGVYSNPTAHKAEALAYYTEMIEMVEKAAEETDEILGIYILSAVTNGWSYEQMKARINIPCGRETYYKHYRRFFWILNRMRK